MKKNKNIVVFSIFLIFMIFSSFIRDSRGNYIGEGEEITIDGQLDGDKYSIVMSLNYQIIYMANSDDELFVYINLDPTNLDDKGISLTIGVLEIDLSNETVNTNYIRSKHNGTKLEFAISRELIDEQIVIKLTVKEFVYTRRIYEFYPRLLKESVPEGISGWGWITIIILLMIGFLIYDLFRRAVSNKVIKAYFQTATKNKNGFEIKRFSGLKIVGIFKSESFNEKKRCYEFTFTKGQKHLRVFSNNTLGVYLNNHFIERIVILYSLNANIFKKKLMKDDYYEVELNWSLQAKIYRFLSFCFNLSSSGILISMLTVGIIFSINLPDVPFAFLIGCPVGLLISTINYLLQTQTEIIKPLLKKKRELVTEELYMAPLESSEEILEIYQVKGERHIQKEKGDGAEQIEIIPLQDDEKDYLTVVGYDDLYNLETDPQVKIKSVKIVGREMRKRTNQEMLNLRRGYLARNRALVEDNFTLKEQNARLGDLVRELQVQMSYLDEKKIKEIQDFGIRMYKQKEKEGTLLRNVLAKLYGEAFVSKNFENVVEKIYRMIEKEKQETKTYTMNILIRSIENLIKLIGEKADLDVNQIKRLMDKIKSEGVEAATEGAS